jgi:hypothetical protein
MREGSASAGRGPVAIDIVDVDLTVLLAERAIERVLTSYSRGVDRFDFDLVRSCYWPDGTDDHGSFSGGVTTSSRSSSSR